MDKTDFIPSLVTVEKFVERIADRTWLRVFPLTQCDSTECAKITKEFNLPEGTTIDVYNVEDMIISVKYEAGRSLPALLFEAGLDLQQPYVVTHGYQRNILACIPRIVEDEEKVEVIQHIHWSEAALRALGMWSKTIRSIWKCVDSSDLSTTFVPVELKAKEPEEKDEIKIDFSRFTDRARRAMGIARQVAQEVGSSHINSGLILVGLAREGSGVAANSLKWLLKAETREEIGRKTQEAYEKCVQAGGTSRAIAVGAKVPFSFRGLEALQLALKESNKLGHHYIGTEHLLLGVAEQEESIAKQMMMNLGMTKAKVRDEVKNLMGLPLD